VRMLPLRGGIRIQWGFFPSSIRRNSRLRGSSRSSLGRIRRGLVGAVEDIRSIKLYGEYGLRVNPGAWAGLEIDKDYLQRIRSV
jgi:hypothetical protein